MSEKAPCEMHDQRGKRSCISVAHNIGLHDQGESLAGTGLLGKTRINDPRPVHEGGACTIPEFVSAPRAAELLECVPSTVTRQCKSGKYDGAKKALVDGVEIWQIPIASLPVSMQRAANSVYYRPAFFAQMMAGRPTCPAGESTHRSRNGWFPKRRREAPW